MAATAREVALKCLLAGEKQGAWSDGYLRNSIRQAGLDRRDAALCTRLAFGVLQNRLLLDWHIARLSSVPTDKLEPAVLNCLRLGIYQMLCMDRVPPHAAVNESVELAKKYAHNPRSAGLVNAVLRAFERSKAEGLPQPEELSVRYSHPQWLVDEFSKALPPDEVEALLAADNAPVPTQAQVNPLKTTQEALIAELSQDGVTATPHPWLENCLELEDTGSLESLPAFREGRFYIQDAAARLAVLAAGPKPGMRVLDACAAPGGKSFAAAIAMENRGEVVSCDLHPHKIKLIREGAARLGLSCISASVMDARKFDPALEQSFDLVIADVPCSGLGVIRKKPDIRYRDPELLKNLPAIQLDILSNISQYVKPGGVLLYSTCTLLPQENQSVFEAFCKKNPGFHPISFARSGTFYGQNGQSCTLTLWPHKDKTDGFFIAKLQRSSD